MIWIDHLTRDDYVCNSLSNDLVMDFGDELDWNNVAQDSDQSISSDCFTHAMVNARCRDFPRSVPLADTIIVCCELANFERTSWLTQRCHKFPESYDVWKLRQTTTSLLTVSKTITLGCATVVQYG